MLWIFIAVPALIWGVLRLILPNQRWQFDFDITHATFFLLLDRYTHIATGIIFAGAAIGSYAKWHGDNQSAYTCFVAALYAFFFVLQVTARYEGYLHAKYRNDGRIGESPYTTAQYAVTRTLAYSAVFFLLLGAARVVLL